MADARTSQPQLYQSERLPADVVAAGYPIGTRYTGLSLLVLTSPHMSTGYLLLALMEVLSMHYEADLAISTLRLWLPLCTLRYIIHNPFKVY